MNKLLNCVFLTLVISTGIAYMVITYLTPNPVTIQQLQAEVQSLRAEVEDVKRVQGWQSYYLEGRR